MDQAEAAIMQIAHGAAIRNAIDLFCGSGAVTAALKRNRVRVVAAVDSDALACRTYRLNHPEVDLIEKDITDVAPCEIAVRHTYACPIDLMIVCAPCQPFSSQNRKRGADQRASLLLETAKFAEALEPGCIFIENVPGLVSPANSAIVDELASTLSPLGYSLSRPRKIDAADLGVPQRRIRCVMVASRSAAALEFFEAADVLGGRMSVGEAIGDLRPLASGESDPEDPLHFARAHSPVVLRRLAAIPPNGGSRCSLPDELELDCHRGRRGFPDVYGRMRWDDVAPTLTTGCNDVTRGRFAHPYQNRAITLREAASLQTFPRDYAFAGNRRQIASQIGNAVPVAMVEALLPLLDQLVRISRSQAVHGAIDA